MYMDELKKPLGCNLISARESFGYKYRYSLIKYVVKPYITSLFLNNNINHCGSYSCCTNNN